MAHYSTIPVEWGRTIRECVLIEGGALTEGIWYVKNKIWILKWPRWLALDFLFRSSFWQKLLKNLLIAFSWKSGFYACWAFISVFPFLLQLRPKVRKKGKCVRGRQPVCSRVVAKAMKRQWTYCTTSFSALSSISTSPCIVRSPSTRLM